MKRGEQSGDTGVRGLTPWAVRFALFWFLAGLAQGCFLPAPIDEEDPTVDEPPRILSTIPKQGTQQVTYSTIGPSFYVTLEEVNVEQELYWRLVVSYDDELNAAVVIVLEGDTERIVPVIKDPTRRVLTAIYSPCDTPQYDLEGRSGTLYIGVSDRPFLRPLSFKYKTSEIGDAFLIDEDRPVASFSWPIKIVGNNNCLHF